MIFEYRVKTHASPKERTVRYDFTPYTNLLKDKTNTKDMWEVNQPNRTIEFDNKHPITLGAGGSSRIRASGDFEEVTIKATLEVEIGKKYLFSTYVRNNDALTSALHINGEYMGSVTDTFTQRILGVFDATSDTADIELKFYDNIPTGPAVAWVGGEMLVEIDEELSVDELKEKYQYVTDSKGSPSARDLLTKILAFSPFKYYLIAKGRRLEHYDRPLIDYGIDETVLIETKESTLDRQIYEALTSDIPLMAMLEGNRGHVTHAFPKEDREMTRLHDSNFPRVQFFTGFAVNKGIADARPVSEEVNFALNIYIPVTKVLESVSAIMILDQSAAIMADLGWSKVRGSDYFLKNEQLYVLQTQYIQDQRKALKRT